MKKTIFIEGMGCSGCENRVKNVLEALPQVELTEAVADTILTETASCGGKYTVTGIE